MTDIQALLLGAVGGVVWFVIPNIALYLLKPKMTNGHLPSESPIALVRARESHYVSTYCIDAIHDKCRMHCKNCSAPCQCLCHVKESERGEDGQRAEDDPS